MTRLDNFAFVDPLRGDNGSSATTGHMIARNERALETGSVGLSHFLREKTNALSPAARHSMLFVINPYELSQQNDEFIVHPYGYISFQATMLQINRRISAPIRRMLHTHII